MPSDCPLFPMERLELRQLLNAPDTTVLDTGFFDDDTREDIVYLSRGNGKGAPRLLIVLSLPEGGFGQPSTVRFSRPGSISSIASGDFDNDGNSDLLVSSYGKAKPGQPGTNNRRTRIHLATGNGDGTFNKPTPVQLGGIQEARYISTANIDDDGNLDLVIASRRNADFSGPQDSDGVFVILGNGDGTFQTAERVTV